MSDKNKKIRFDEYLVLKKIVGSRHQAADLIKRQQVKLNGRFVDKPAFRLDPDGKQRIQLKPGQLYVSRAAYKLEAAAETLGLQFEGKIVFDVGAHQGGFTDFACRRSAKHIVAVDVGRQPLAQSLMQKENILSFTKTDVRDFIWPLHLDLPDLIIVDLSFISLTKVLDTLLRFCHSQSRLLLLVKPQFEAEGYNLKSGVIKNRLQRKAILKRFEVWLKANDWVVLGKTDSKLAGLKGNLECFYFLRPVKVTRVSSWRAA